MLRSLVVIASLLAASVARADSYDVLAADCNARNAGALYAELFCSCLVDELKKTVSEADLAAYFRPEASPTDPLVDRQGRAAAQLCSEKVAEQSTRI